MLCLTMKVGEFVRIRAPKSDKERSVRVSVGNNGNKTPILFLKRYNNDVSFQDHICLGDCIARIINFPKNYNEQIVDVYVNKINGGRRVIITFKADKDILINRSEIDKLKQNNYLKDKVK